MGLSSSRVFLCNLVAQLDLLRRIVEAQRVDEMISGVAIQLREGTPKEDWTIGADGGVCFHSRICVPKDETLREEVLREAHHSRFTIHPGGNKMYRDL